MAASCCRTWKQYDDGDEKWMDETHGCGKKVHAREYIRMGNATPVCIIVLDPILSIDVV